MNSDNELRAPASQEEHIRVTMQASPAMSTLGVGCVWLLAIAGSPSPLPASASLLIGIACILALSLLERGGVRISHNITLSAAALVSWIVFPEYAWLTSAAFFAALAVLARPPSAVSFVVLSTSAGVCAALDAVISNTTLARLALDKTATLYSRVISALAGTEISFGPTVLAFGLLCVGITIIACLVATAATVRVRLASRGIAILVLLHAACTIGVAASSARFGDQERMAFLHVWTMFVAVAVCVLLVVLYVGRASILVVPDGLRKSVCGTVAGVAVVVIVCSGSAGRPQPQSLSGLRVVLFTQGYLALTSPVFGLYGRDGMGMFGLLPQCLEGKRATFIQSSVLDAAVLDSADVLVLINLQKELSSQEHELVWGFVRRGKGLLVLGDHTGAAGIREPFNRLLEPVGIRFNFDCAKPLLADWTGSIEAVTCELTRGLVNDQYAIGVGASLDVDSGASAVLVGALAYSDAGDHSRSSEGNIGDFRYVPGERLGDLVLVASAVHGLGRVLVFGDTSTFQNGSLPDADMFIRRCVYWLSGRPSSDLGAKYTVIALSAAAGLGALAFAIRRQFSLVGVVLAGTTSVQAIWRRPGPEATAEMSTWPVALIDVGHRQPLDRMWWERDSIGALQANLLRCRIWAAPTSDALQSLCGARVLIVPVPGVGYNSAEVASVQSFVRAGNVAIVFAGYGKESNSLSRSFGFELSGEWHGPVNASTKTGRVKCYAATSFSVLPAGAEVVVEFNGKPIVAWTRCGEGICVAVADPHLFSTFNLESLQQYYPENVELIRSMVELLRTEGIL